MSNLKIGRPEIKKLDNCYRLIANIKSNDIDYDLWFEVEEKYSKYLCDENCNAFLVALIPFIVKHDYDVEIDAKISSKLYYQLTTYLLPLICSNLNKKIPKINCELTNQKFSSTGVGASISCGVDSFYTLLKHKNQKDSSYNITHLTFFNAGSHGDFGGENARELFKRRLIRIKKFCDENNYELVTVDSNMNELIMMNHEKTHTFRTLACVFALEKLFGKYYFASGFHFKDTHIDESDAAYYDILNVHCLSNENIDFYSSGMEKTRMQKVEYIANHSETYNWLNVCVNDTGDNCGICKKCIRTITALESIGKLDKYSNVFNLDYYYKNRTKIIANMYKLMRNPIQRQYYSEIINSYKKNNRSLPISSRFLSLIPNKDDIKSIVKKIIPNKILKKIKIKKGTYNNDGWCD